MKKLFWVVFFCTFFIPKSVAAEKINYGAEKTISRGEVAKMISFIDSEKNDIIELYKSRNINFIDADKNKWHDKYINCVFNKKIMSGIANKFEPEKPLTLSQAQFILDKLNKNSDVKIKITDDNKNKCISYSLWVKLFQAAIENSQTHIEQKKIIALATPLQNKKIPPHNIFTDENYYSCEGIEFDFFDKEVEILSCGHEIIAILNYDEEYELDCTITKQIGRKIFVTAGPVKRFYKLQTHKKILPGDYKLKIVSGQIIEIAPQISPSAQQN